MLAEALLRWRGRESDATTDRKSMTEDPAIRSRIMRAVKSKDTAPEMTVRRLAHRMGYRFRLHRKDLPGKPDVVFPRLHKALFVHGCFWHGHNCPRGSRVPKTNADYWTKKISRNRTRDDKAQRSLKALGWRVFVVWECELSDIEKAARSIKAILKAA